MSMVLADNNKLQGIKQNKIDVQQENESSFSRSPVSSMHNAVERGYAEKVRRIDVLLGLKIQPQAVRR